MSISSTDSTNGDKKYEEENSNHSESEELQMLRAKIAELEGASSIASFDVLAPNGNEAINESDTCFGQFGGVDQQLKNFRGQFAKLEMELRETKQMNVVTNLENKALQAEMKHQKLLMFTEQKAMEEKIAKMEKEQQKMADQLARRQNDQQLELEQFKQENATDSAQLNKSQKAILVKIDELAQQVTDSELFKQAFPAKFDAMENFVGVLKDRFGKELLKAVHADIRPSIAEVFSNPAQNCWDITASHNELEIFGPECLMVHYKSEGNGGDWPWRVAFSKHSLPCSHYGIFYYEVKVLNVKRYIKIGFATKKLVLDTGVGEKPDSYGYVNDGCFWLNGTQYSGKPKFARDDTVGCGFNLVTGRIIFTKNGQRLDTADVFASPTSQWFPCVSLLDSGDLINANFGPNFKFDPSSV
ncbi:hypothetical protein niasHT_032361 [Heterodera trifolii]|uniref:B30.2/SPRY domain-containing protein n=1 Tax=Heterodera trifolii TaxID=157864 RepID=A0ABD2HZR7_9BILA